MDSSEVANRIMKGIDAGALNGNVSGNTFTVGPRLVRPHPFTPVAKGTIERSSRGSVVFIRYELLRSMKATVLFWCSVVIGGSVAAALQSHSWWLVAVGVAMAAVARWIAVSNQRLHVDTVRKSLRAFLPGTE